MVKRAHHSPHADFNPCENGKLFANHNPARQRVKTDVLHLRFGLQHRLAVKRQN